jgi:Zn-dependent peptidase ImmA (M78 family)
MKAINTGTRGTMRLYRRGTIPAYYDPEWQANEFGAAMLMPTPGIVRLVSKHRGVFRSVLESLVADQFGVSAAAAKLRIRILVNAGAIDLKK